MLHKTQYSEEYFVLSYSITDKHLYEVLANSEIDIGISKAIWLFLINMRWMGRLLYYFVIR